MKGELLGRLQNYSDLYRVLRASASFEDALGSIQADTRAGRIGVGKRHEQMQRAVLDTFEDMNKALLQFRSLNFAAMEGEESVHTFMSRFDCIFTLNQDLLLEFAYSLPPPTSHNWAGIYYPGIDVPAIWDNLSPEGRFPMRLRLLNQWDDIPDRQPIYKLHGSVNWDGADGSGLVVIGGGKKEYIDRQPLLKRYAEEFHNRLCAGGAKLMVIGYSFLDDHINQIILNGCRNHDLRVHIVDPAGLGVLENRGRGAIRGPQELADVRVIGVGSREFRSAFPYDTVFRRSLFRFFDS